MGLPWSRNTTQRKPEISVNANTEPPQDPSLRCNCVLVGDKSRQKPATWDPRQERRTGSNGVRISLVFWKQVNRAIDLNSWRRKKLSKTEGNEVIKPGADTTSTESERDCHESFCNSHSCHAKSVSSYLCSYVAAVNKVKSYHFCDQKPNEHSSVLDLD